MSYSRFEQIFSTNQGDDNGITIPSIPDGESSEEVVDAASSGSPITIIASRNTMKRSSRAQNQDSSEEDEEDEAVIGSHLSCSYRTGRSIEESREISRILRERHKSPGGGRSTQKQTQAQTQADNLRASTTGKSNKPKAGNPHVGEVISGFAPK